MTGTIRVLAVTNLYPTAAAPATGTFVQEHVESLRTAGIEVVLMHVDRAGGRGVYRNLAARVGEEIETTKPDIVHAMYGGVLAHQVSLAARKSAVPFVVSFCGSDLVGGMYGPLARRARERVGILASQRAARAAAAIIVKSDVLKSGLPRSVPDARVRTIASGVDLARFRPIPQAEARATLGWDPAKPLVLFPASRTRPRKRYALAQAAIEVLRRTVPEVDLYIFEGVRRDDVPLVFNAVDAMIMTSIVEGSPNTVKEATACCLPVVSVEVGDVRERLAGLSGSSVTAADPDALAAGLELALRTPRDPRGRSNAEQVSLERQAAKTIALYDDVLAADRL